jgi:hypothetical protein
VALTLQAYFTMLLRHDLFFGFMLFLAHVLESILSVDNPLNNLMLKSYLLGINIFAVLLVMIPWMYQLRNTSNSTADEFFINVRGYLKFKM